MTQLTWRQRIGRWPIVRPTIALTQRVIPPGCQGFSLYSILNFIWDGFFKGKLQTRAAAISFKILLAMAPTLILIFTLIPYIPIKNFQSDLIESIQELLPASTFEMVEGTLTDLIAYKHDTFLSISFFLGIYYASNSIMAIFEGFSSSYHVQQRLNPYRSRLVAISLVFFLPLFIAPPFLVITFSETVLNYLLAKGFLKEGLELLLILVSKWLTVLIFFNLSISTIYYFGNPRRKPYRFFTPGSVVATIAFILVSQGFAYYVNNFGNYNKFYGSLGTIIVLLVWVEFNSIILLIGYELNASIQKAVLTKAQELTPETIANHESKKL